MVVGLGVRTGLLRGFPALGFALAALVSSGAARAAPNTHDGFYLQLTGGAGFVHSSAEVTTRVLSYENGPYVSSTGTITYSGVSASFSAMLGGTIGRGIVLGGGLFNEYVPVGNEKVRISGTGGADPDFSMSLVALGAFADIYFSSTSGLHLQPFAGYGWLVFEDEARSNTPAGPTLGLGFGNDWWVGSEWSIGIMGRVVVAPLGYSNTTFMTLAPVLLATFTYH